jgi:hypothetical protein
MSTTEKMAQALRGLLDECGFGRIITDTTASRDAEAALADYEADTPTPLTPREHELLDGLIARELDHAAQCDGIANRRMAERQKDWDMERVALLRKLKGTT